MSFNNTTISSMNNATDIFISNRNNPFTFSLTCFASLFSILTNGYVICIIKVLTSKENSLAILNLSILEMASSITSLFVLFTHGNEELCSVIFQLRISLFVIGLYSVGYVNMEIYLKIFEPFSDSYSNSRLFGIVSTWSSGIVTLVLVKCLNIQFIDCKIESDMTLELGNFTPFFIGVFVFILGLPSFLIMSFQVSVFIRILQHRRLRHRGRISLKKKKPTEISSNFSTATSSSSSSNSSKECLRVIVLKASSTTTSSTVHGTYPNRTTTKTIVTKKRKYTGLGSILSDDRKMLVSSGILIFVFLSGQFLPSILTVIHVLQWKEFISKELQRQIQSYCRCFVAILHPLIYGILRENFRNLFKMLQKRRNRSLS